MEVEQLAVMIPIVSVISIVVMIIYIRRYANVERMAMIEKGVDPSLFWQKTRNTSGALRASLLLMGAGLGLLLGNFLYEYMHLEEEVAYFSMLFICGGAGLGLAYRIEEKKAKDNPS